MRNNFLVYSAPLIGEDEINEVNDSLNTGWLGTGPKVHKFEKLFAAYKGVDKAVAVNSCTAALHLSLVAANLMAGDEVITTPMTFCATVNSIIHAGATPVLADVDPITMNLDPSAVEAAITSKTKAILVVHFGGHPCQMDEFSSIAKKHNLILIEDCAHAIETKYKGKPAGTIGDFGCFSFYVTKNIVTGEGGMVLAGEKSSLERIKTLSLHGMSLDAWNRFGKDGYKHYEVIDCGFKYNMMDLQAAIGIHQLKRIDEMWSRRKQIWDKYSKELVDLPIKLPNSILDTGSKHAYHLFPIQIDIDNSGISRDQFLIEMSKLNIGVGVHYRSISEHPYYQNRFQWRPESWPNALKIGQHTVSLSLSPKMTDLDVSDVIEAVRSILKD
jgi:dTDP-4-amino-4,6-dideoxygalactose transaminase